MKALDIERNQQSVQLEVMDSLQSTVRESLDRYIRPVSDCWQPQDLLPDMARDDWSVQIEQLRKSSESVPDDLLVVLVGDMITEEALPSYQTWFNGLSGLKDPTGISDLPWARWIRGWTAEENRHGDLLNKYLYLTGRVDMKVIEVTIQHLIRNGFFPNTESDPYQGIVYTSFQERATKISHRNVSILASRIGDRKLQDICGIIAGDEARHERAYQAFMKGVFERDPSGAVLAFSKMMKKKIMMPGSLMSDGKNECLYSQFSNLAQKLGVYTARDYASVIDHLIKTWGVENLGSLSTAAAEAQDYVCSLPARYFRLAGRFKFSNTKREVSWIFDRKV